MSRAPGEPDLGHHGDRDVRPGMVDLAVNVRVAEPPVWLASVIRESLAGLGSYPDAGAARAALAAHHGVDEAMVLPTAGGAEAFTLMARGLAGADPLVVHPQFTEPDTALRAAGRTPRWAILEAGQGFRLAPGAVDDAADLVVVGNPTNPTGALHAADELRALRRDGRGLVVDEAFMDAVQGEPESLIGKDMAGIVVLRSLTKTWGLAGLRAGYVVGDPELVTAMAAQQPHWSVSTPALAVMCAVASHRARTEAEEAARLFDARRAHLVAGLGSLGVRVSGEPRTPFVLAEVGAGVREALHAEGFAVRRGDTFPGLGPPWIRVAVRDEATSEAFVAALGRVLAGADSTGGAGG
ncbi:Rv2231c family pyridoxal phosphate-dependent protein CobC [Mariniluteicoccus flavus]